MGPATHQKDSLIFRFLINAELLYRELLEAYIGSGDVVSHCGGPYRVAPLDLSSESI